MKDLTDLYRLCSPSGHEEPVASFLEQTVSARFPNASLTKDRAGNIYVTKGTAENYPCIVAHMDEVHDANPHKEIIERNGIVFGYDTRDYCTTGIGADDKNGVWICLKALERLANLKCAFFVGEEIGCVGSSQADMDFFKDCKFVLQCDRRGFSDFINVASGVELCDKSFVKKCRIKDFGYSTANGAMTDVMALKQRGLDVAAANISCGYHNPHTDSEATVIAELLNCLDLVLSICKNVGRHPHKASAQRTHSNSYGFWKGNNSRYWYSDADYDSWHSYYDNGDSYLPQKKKATEEELTDFIFDRFCRDANESYTDTYDACLQEYVDFDYKDFSQAYSTAWSCL